MSSIPSPTTQDPEAAQLNVLRLLQANPSLTQRDLSRALGLSLGKTHYVLHALLDKGLVKIRNFRRSDRKLAYAYILTPAGVREKLRLTRNFLSRKEAEFEQLQSTIAELRAALAHHDEEQISRSGEREREAPQLGRQERV
jgi:EPS-associated MarR family transcriptional regulator